MDMHFDLIDSPEPIPGSKVKTLDFENLIIKEEEGVEGFRLTPNLRRKELKEYSRDNSLVMEEDSAQIAEDTFQVFFNSRNKCN